MSDEATEEKKGKKKKEKKPKKEKPPKEKKPKKEKPPKEKKAKKGKDAPEGAEGEEGGKKKGPPLLLILIPVFVVAIVGVAALVMFVILPRLRGGSADADEIPEDPDAALTAQVENTERAKNGDKSADADAEASDADDESADTDAEVGDAESADGAEGDADGAEASPPEQEKSVDIVVSMTTSESIAYFRGLSPESLGLPGESMDDYDIFASEHLIFVDDVPCKEFKVYSIADRTGTNSVEGLYLMTQRGARKIYRLDEATNTVTELQIKPPAPATPEPEPEPVPEGEPLPEEEPPDHM